MPRVNLCEEGFRVTDLNFSNLPRAPKLPERDDNIQKIVYDLIHGTVAAGTNVQWGIEFDVDDDDNPQLIGTEDSEFFKIFHIVEERPNSDKVYRVTFVFLQNNSPDLLTDEQIAELNTVRRVLSRHPEMQQIRQLLPKAKDALDASGSFDVGRAALVSFMRIFDRMCGNERVPLEFASLLLFCENCEDDMMTMACQAGCIDTFFLNPLREATLIFKNFETSGKLSPADVGRLTQLIVNQRSTSMISTNPSTPQPSTPPSAAFPSLTEDEIQSTIDVIQEWKSKHPGRHFLSGQLRRYFLPFIDIPHFLWVGNLQVAFKETSSYSSVMDIKSTLKEHRDIQSVIRNSSCTLLMALTMMHLRRHGYQVMDLENAGRIGGCICYSNASSVNDMMSIMGNSKTGLRELLHRQSTNHKFKVFNRNDCISADEYVHSGDMYFIDIPSAVCLFTKRKDRLIAKAKMRLRNQSVTEASQSNINRRQDKRRRTDEKQDDDDEDEDDDYDDYQQTQNKDEYQYAENHYSRRQQDQQNEEQQRRRELRRKREEQRDREIERQRQQEVQQQIDREIERLEQEEQRQRNLQQ